MFDRVISLIGEDNFLKLQKVKVLIVGVGGVGGYALETLARSGITNIDIIDYDKIELSNLNRQVIATTSNINNYKVDEAKSRVLSINPNISIKIYKDFLNKENIDRYINNNYDYIIDACDSVDTKIELIKKSVNDNFKLISCMGTAKKIDPTKLSITTLDKTNYDPLAKVLRKKIKDLNINLKRIKVVSSTEKIIDCETLGSLMLVPSTAGILCAKYIIDDIIEKY